MRTMGRCQQVIWQGWYRSRHWTLSAWKMIKQILLICASDIRCDSIIIIIMILILHSTHSLVLYNLFEGVEHGESWALIITSFASLHVIGVVGPAISHDSFWLCPPSLVSEYSWSSTEAHQLTKYEYQVEVQSKYSYLSISESQM